jgi:hypothetical protein
MMSGVRGWLVGLAVLGGTAAVAAGALFWMLVAHPVDLARALAGGW